MIRRSHIYPFTLCVLGLVGVGCSGDSPDVSNDPTTGSGGAGTGTSSGQPSSGATDPSGSGAGAGSGVGPGSGSGGSTSTVDPTSTASTSSGDTTTSTGSGPVPTVPKEPPSGIPGKFRVNEEGRVTVDGRVIQVRGGNWFGLEGQDDNDRPGAMELFIGSVFWSEANEKRTIKKTMDELKSELTFNTIRLPIAPQTLDPNHPDGNYSTESPRIRNNDPEFYPYANAYDALVDFLKQADQNGLYVILGVHSCSNHIGWRAGKLDDAPPWVDSSRENYEYKKDNYTCASGEDAYDKTKWLQTIRTMAQLPKKIGVKNILGIDCFNEPWKYSWAQWADLAKECYDVIAAEDDDIIAVIQGVSGGHEKPGQTTIEVDPEPNGDREINPNWGENFYGMRDYGIKIPHDRLCFSPHTYGPSVYVQKQHIDRTKPGCEDVEDEEAAKNQCPLIVTKSNTQAVANMRKGWDQHFGFLHDQNFCVIIGEFGGTKDWPKNEMEPEAATTWAYLGTTERYDWNWQNIFVDYLIDKKMTDFTYWSINPESGDTGGIYNHKYTNANKGGWGTWTGLDTEKVQMLNRLK